MPAGGAGAVPADGLPVAGPCPASPLCLAFRVETPHSVDRARCFLGSSGSLESLGNATACRGIQPEAPASALQAAIRELDAKLPLADILQLRPGDGYLVVRRQLAPAPSSTPAMATAPAAPSMPPSAQPAWTAAAEQRYQQQLMRLAQLAQLRASLWPGIQAWLRRQAALRALTPPAPQQGHPLQHLLRWAVMQRLRQLQQLQRQSQLARVAPQPPPPPELEASTVLLQLSQDPSGSTASKDASSRDTAMPPPPPRQPLKQPMVRSVGAVHSQQPTAQHSMCLAAQQPALPTVRLQPAQQQAMAVRWAPLTPRLHPAGHQQLVPPPAKRQRLAAPPSQQ